MKLNRTNVRELIETAFAGVTCDSEQTLHQAQLTDQGLWRRIHGNEWANAGSLDSEMDWRDIPSTSIDECDAALSHATNKSWCFFIPAYLCRVLLYEDATLFSPIFKNELLHSVIFHLTYRENKEAGPNRYLLERYEMLNDEQCEAIRVFLRFIEEESLAFIRNTNQYYASYDQAQAALANYWDLPKANRPNSSLLKAAKKGLSV